MRQDSWAERSKAVVTGAIPKGRGLEPHSFQRLRCCWRGERNLDWQCHYTTTADGVRKHETPNLCHSWGESGWCSDETSTHGAWRHAGVRFLLSSGRFTGMYHIQPEVKRSEFSARRGA